MRKGLATGVLLVFVFVAAYLAAGAPTALSTAAPRTTPALATEMSAFEPEVERVALTSRDRARRAIGEPGQWDVVPTAAGEATALLEQLVMAERAVRDPAVTGKELAYMGHLQQLVYFQLIQRADLRDPVFSGIPKDLRRAADLNIAALANLWLGDSTYVTELPEWRIVSRSEEHTSELQSQSNLVCRLLLEKKNNTNLSP